MVLWSEISYSQTVDNGRIDAEYYQPNFIIAQDKLRGKSSILLNQIGEIVCSAFYPAATELYDRGEIPFLRCVDVIDYPIVTKDQDFAKIPANFLEANKNIRFVMAGDIVISKVGTPCFAALIDESMPLSALTRTVIGIKGIDKTLIDPRYLVIYLRSSLGFNQLMRERELTIQYQLTLERTGNVQVVLPSREEQEIIGDMLSEYAKKKREARNLYFLAETLFLSELGVEENLLPEDLYYEEAYINTFAAKHLDAEYYQPKYKALLEVSHTTKLTPLEEMITFNKGIEVGSSAYTISDNPFWRVSNLTKHGMDESNLVFINHELYRSLQPNYEPRQGEILLSKDATPGIAYYLESPIKGIISSGILRIQVAEGIPPYYLELVLNSYFVQLQIEQVSGGSIIKHWTPKDIRATLIPRLPSDTETKIAELVNRSHLIWCEANLLLEKAKQRVEQMAI